MVMGAFTLVHFAVPPQVGNHGEVATTAVDFACKRLLSGMAVHVRLQRTWAGKSLIADFALVLLLRT